MIHFVLSGKGRLEVAGRTFHLGAGDAFLVPAETVTYYEADQEDPWHYTWINFLGITSRQYLLELMEQAEETYVLRHLPVEKYYATIQEVLPLNTASVSDYLLANSMTLYILSQLFYDTGQDQDPARRGSIAEEVKLYLDVNYYEPLQIRQVARQFGVHPNYLTRVFRQAYGRRPQGIPHRPETEKGRGPCSLPPITRWRWWPALWGLKMPSPFPGCSKSGWAAPPANSAAGRQSPTRTLPLKNHSENQKSPAGSQGNAGLSAVCGARCKY